MSWLEQIDEAMVTQFPSLAEAGFRVFPRLLLSPTAQGPNKPAVYFAKQNNIRLQLHIADVRPWAQSHGYEYLGLYNFSIQHDTADGVHAGMEANMVKAQMILNWLNMLEPLPRLTSRPRIPSKPTAFWHEHQLGKPVMDDLVPEMFPPIIAPIGVEQQVINEAVATPNISDATLAAADKPSDSEIAVPVPSHATKTIGSSSNITPALAERPPKESRTDVSVSRSASHSTTSASTTAPTSTGASSAASVAALAHPSATTHQITSLIRVADQAYQVHCKMKAMI